MESKGNDWSVECKRPFDYCLVAFMNAIKDSDDYRRS
jgi:hypothetical protein